MQNGKFLGPNTKMFALLVVGLLLGGGIGLMVGTNMTKPSNSDFEDFKQNMITELENNSKLFVKVGNETLTKDFLTDTAFENSDNQEFAQLTPELRTMVNDVYEDIRETNHIRDLYEEYSTIAEYYRAQYSLNGNQHYGDIAEEYEGLSMAFIDPSSVIGKIAQSDIPDNMLSADLNPNTVLSKIAQSDTPDTMLSLLTALKASTNPV